MILVITIGSIVGLVGMFLAAVFVKSEEDETKASIRYKYGNME